MVTILFILGFIASLFATFIGGFWLFDKATQPGSSAVKMGMYTSVFVLWILVGALALITCVGGAIYS